MAKKSKLSGTKIDKKRYQSNLRDSMKNLGGHYVATHMPTLSQTVVTAQTAVNSFRLGTLKNKNRLRMGLRANNVAMRSYMGQTFANMKDSLKTGKFFNTPSDEDDTALGYMMEDYGDDDIGGSGTDQMMSEISANMSRTASTVEFGLRETSNVVAGSADHVADTLNTISTQQSVESIRRHMESMSVLGNIQKLSQANLNFQLNEMTGFIQSSMSFYDRAGDALDNIYQEIQKLTELNEARYGGSRGTGTSKIHDLENIFGSNGLNLSEYFSTIKKNAKNKSGMGGLAMDIFKEGAGNFKENPIGSILKLAMSAGTSKAMKGAMGNVNETLNGAFATYLLGMNRLKTNKNPFARFLGEMLGVDLNKMVKPNTASYKTEQITLEVENKKIKAITEVIPQYLSEITRALTNIDKVYDYDKGTFVDRKKRKDELMQAERGSALASMSDSKRYMSDNLYKIEGNMSSNEKALYQEDLDSFIYFLATVGENVDPSKMTYEYAEKRGLKLRGGRQSFTMMKALYSSLTKTQKASVRREQLSSITAMRDYRQHADQQLNFSGGMMAFNNFYDGNEPPTGGMFTSPNQARQAQRQQSRARSKAGSSASATGSFSGMSAEDILAHISGADEVGPRPSEEDRERTMGDEFNNYKSKFTSKIKKFFNLKDHKVLNSLFGEEGFFPGVLNATADTISDVMYGDDPKKNKGVFGELFGNIKDTAKQHMADIKTVFQDKFGKSDFYKKIFGDKEKGELGLVGEFTTVFKNEIISPVKETMNKHVFGPLKDRFKKFYDAHLKDRLSGIHSKAEEIRKKVGEKVGDATKEFVGSTDEYYDVGSGSSTSKESPDSIINKWKNYEYTAADAAAKLGISTSTLYRKYPRSKKSDAGGTSSAQVFESGISEAPMGIQKVQIVGGQNGLPVIVQLSSPDTIGGVASGSETGFNDVISHAIKNVPTDAIKDTAANIAKQLAGEKDIPSYAKGGKTKSGLSVVGEHGAELIATGGGSTIHSADKPISVKVEGYGEKAQEFQAQAAGYIAGSTSASGRSKNKSGGGGGAASKIAGLLGSAKEKIGDVKEGKVFEGLKSKFSGAGSAAAGAFISTALGLGPTPGIIVGAMIGNRKAIGKEKSKMQEEAKAQGKEFDKEAWELRKQQMKASFGGSTKGAIIGSAASTILGLGPMPGLIIGSLIGRKAKLKDKKAAEDAGKDVEGAQNDEKKGKFKGLFGKVGGAAVGGVASTLLGLGPLPGIILGTVIQNHRKKKKDAKRAEQEGKQVDDAQKQEKKQGLLSKFKGAAIGGVASTLLGLGPIPGIVIGSIISGRKKKKDLKEAEKAGQEVDGERKKQKGGILGFFKKAKGATIGALTSTLLGLGPVPGLIIGSLLGGNKKKKDLKEAEKAGQEVDGERKKQKGGILKRLLGGGIGAAVGGVASAMLGLGPMPGIIVGSIAAAAGAALAGRKKKDKKDAQKMGDEVDKKRQNPDGTPMLTDGNDGDEGGTPGKKGGVFGLFNKGINSVREKMRAAKEAISKKRQEAQAAKRTQSDTKKLLNSAKTGDGTKVMKNVSNNLGSSDTSKELGALEQSTSIMANASSIASNSSQISEMASGGGSGEASGVMGALGALLGGSSLWAIAKNFIKKKVVKGGKKFVKNNIGDAYSMAQIGVGAKNIKEGSELMKSDDTVDKQDGSGQIVRGSAQVASGGIKLAGTVAKAATSATKSKSVVGKLTQWIAKMIKKIASKSGDDVAKKILLNSGDNVAGAVIKKFAPKLAAKAASFLAKWSQPIGWAIVIAQAVWDFSTGMADVKNIMKTSASYDPPMGLRVTCGLAKAISGLLLGLIPVDWLTGLIYGLVGGKSNNEELKKSQEAQKSEYDEFIKAHPEAVEKGLTQEKYNKIQNKSTWTKFVEWLPFTKKSSLDDYTNDKQTNNVVIVNNNGESGSGARGVTSGKTTIKDVLNNVSGILSTTAKGKASKQVVATNKQMSGKPSDTGRGRGSARDMDARGFFSNIVNTVKSWFAGDSSKNDEKKMTAERTEAISPVPYYSQIDPKWKDRRFGSYNGLPDTIGAGGCGPATAAMMFESLTGQPQNVYDLAMMAETKGFKHNGTSTRFFKHLGNEYGIGMNIEDGLSGSAIAALNKGIPVALIGKNKDGNAPFGPGNHYVLGTNANDRGINIYDPLNSDNNKRYSIDALGADTEKSIIPQVSSGSGGRGITIPVSKASSALAYKNSNKMNKTIAAAQASINETKARGDGDTSVDKIASIAQAMLDALTGIGETLIRIEENSIRGTSSSSNPNISVRSSASSYSSKTDSSAKSTMYTKAVTA